MNLVLFGPPGAGKGTQARLIHDRHHLTLIATGDILREEIKRKTPLGIEIEETITLGRFPSDEIILKVFEEHLAKPKSQGLILDGLPRTLNQAQKIDEVFDRRGLEIDAVIQLKVDEEELIKRLSVRVICQSCGASYTQEDQSATKEACDKCLGRELVRRPDDEPEAVKTRLHVYNEQTKPVLDYYAKRNLLSIVDGMGSVEEVSAQIEFLLGKLQKDCKKTGKGNATVDR